ncbi:winged helix DNA-binding domain-containing protein [Cnuibacter sp. UC19_7]|uniref:winged helix DNA-binding domain-containing protein n=1 Tax=Cnuibacter sp. UC19_7 TaxID=3350166 RepID=UPI00366BCF0B
MALRSADIPRLRLEAQRAVQSGRRSAAGHRSAADEVVAAVERLVAVQAQDFGQSLWALGARAPGATLRDVEAAFESRRIVRSWPMRGTLHILSPDDLRAILDLTAERTIASARTRHRGLGLDDDTFARATAILRDGLAGRSLDREETLALLAAGGVATDGQRGIHLLWRLAHDGLICWGPTDTTRQRLVLLDEWAPPREEPTRDETLRRLLLRYVAGHGPVTLRDFVWWTKLTVKDATRARELAGDELVEHEVDGQIQLMTPDAPERPSRSSSGVVALPSFDEYLIGYPDRTPMVRPEWLDRVVPGANGLVLPIVVSAGQVVGTWRRRLDPGRIRVSVEPFEPWSEGVHRGVERHLAALGRFFERPVELVEALR